MTDAPRQRIETILQQLDQLPPLPAVATRVMQVASSDTSSVADVVRIIEADPAIAARILQLVHRADSGVSGQVTDLGRAITLLGFDAVRCAILSISVLATLRPAQNATAEEKFSRTEFWKHCIAVAACCELIAAELAKNWGKSAGVESGEAFLAGLLHDMGKIALCAVLPKSFAKVIETADLLRGNIADVERSIIGIDHLVVGKRLAERWQLPTSLRDAIWLHGQLPQALPASVKNERLVNVVTLADLLVREQRLGYSGNYTFPIARQSLLDALGLLPNQADAVLEKLMPAIEARATAFGIDGANAEDLYRNAFEHANRELGRVTDQLATKNRKLAVRAKYFDAIAAFQGELKPDAAPARVLQAIGRTAAGVLETATVAVFSVPPATGYAEISVIDRQGQVTQSHLVDSIDGSTAIPQPADIVVPDSAGAMHSVPNEMEWLVGTVSPRLDGANRFWIPLYIEGACVGGVVWGAANGEMQRLSPQNQELSSLACGWALALRTSQIRDEARALAEQLADVNRRLHSAQSEIDRTKMLTSVAEIAAGAAHEMNNPLMVISGRSQLLASTLSDVRQRDNAKLIYEKSQTLSDIITALMHFAKPQPPQPRPCNIESLFGSALDAARDKADPGARQIDIRGGDLPPAHVDGGQIAAALSEIVLNAVEATDAATGRIGMTASFDAFGQRLVLTIADNGMGMDEHVLRHAFDPFFSQKRAGRQPGMGLSKAVRWIESAGGTVRLESKVNAGTRAIVILPAAQESVAETDTPSAMKRAT